MDPSSFVHLHTHTEFSLLDGAARVSDLVEAAKADDQPALGISDHGSLYGAIDFYVEARRAGLRPIIGVEAYLTPGSRFDRPTRGDNIRYHLTLLAENDIGYRNLVQLVSRAYQEGYYYKPRMDNELLSEYSEGIIATSGCLGGPVAQRLAPDASREEGNQNLVRDFDAALAAAGQLQDIFGRDQFFIEIQNHGLEVEERILPDLKAISDKVGAPLLATNDSHYTYRTEAEAHDVLLCIQTGTTIDDGGRLRFEGDSFYLKTAAEMRTLFPADEFPGACDNTLHVADRASVELEFGGIHLPQFPVPASETESTYLRQLVYEGAAARYGDPLPPDVDERIRHELEIIDDMGFPAYFLIVWDLIRYARERGIRIGPGRGSAAGSIVAYSLRITDLDPLRWGLIFERFLNPGRRQMPDIDMDFDERYRSDVIRYAASKYGSDHVAQIITFSTIKGRQAVRDAARVLGFPYGLGDRVAKMMPPPILGKEATLAQSLTEPSSEADPMVRDFYANAAPLRDSYEADKEVKRVVDTARGLEGLRRQDSIHAAAVVISPRPLAELVPVQQKGEEAEIVTQYEMGAIERLGLLKMDFLGLRNLSTIERALELIRRSQGEEIDIDSVPLDDAKTFEMLQRGETIGVFQLEGSAMRALLRNLRPDRLEEIIALNALYRPGPLGAGMHTKFTDRKWAREAVDYPHPALEPVLAETYGIMVYQEQVMQVAEIMAGYSMAEADTLRKAMGKKIPAVMTKQKEKFVSGGIAQGHPESLGRELFDQIAHFAGYGFNKSHSAAYGLVAYQTAYLKANYPAPYMAALLTSTKRDKDRMALYLNECRTMGLAVLVPDVNSSEMDFTVSDGAIRFGLSAVRNVGESIVTRILEARTEGGPFASFQDFEDRVDLSVLNKRTLESLIKAGTFDSLRVSRRGLMLSFEASLDATVTRRRNEDMGQYSLFGSSDDGIDPYQAPIPTEEWPRKTQLAFEKEMLGLYVSDHPLLGVRHLLEAATTASISALWELPDGSAATIGGLVGPITRRFTRNGEPMLFFQLEDLEASIEVVAFPRVAGQFSGLVASDAVLLVEGRLDHRGDDLKFVASRISEPELTDETSVKLEIPSRLMSPSLIERLKAVLTNHPGPSPVYVHMTSSDGHKVLKLSDEHRVEARSALYAELRELLGSKAVL
ncbi:MAG: DNA polymerase III subunit alpha [Acidimicrobiia bacterium]